MTGRVIMNGPPEGRWCIICLMDVKQRQWESFQDEIQAGYAKSADDPPTVIPWLDALTKEIGEGYYRGVCGDLPQLGIVDGLCWHHVAGINPTPLPAIDTTTKLPPGLLRKGKPS